MVSFLIVLAFAPVLVAVTWVYTSPLSRLNAHIVVKVIIRIILGTALLGGLFAQIFFLSHHLSLPDRRTYILALLVIEAFPLTVLMVVRDPQRRKSNATSRGDAAGKKDNGAVEN